MIKTIKAFDRGDHFCVVDSTSGSPVTSYIGKDIAPTEEIAKTLVVPKYKGKIPNPSLLTKGVNYYHAQKQHRQAGSPIAPDSVIVARWEKCLTCKLLQPNPANPSKEGTCLHPSCGCTTATVGVQGRNKLAWADQECPIKRWLAHFPQKIG